MQHPAPTRIHRDLEHLPDEALLRLRFMTESGLVPWSAATLWRKCRAKEFPAPVKVSANITAWRWGDVRKWLQNPIGYAVGDEPHTPSRGKARTCHRGRA